MKNILYVALIGFFLYSCGGARDREVRGGDNLAQGDTVRIANDSLEYEILIIDPGFANFLASQARPKGYYSQSYLESKNRFLVQDYNQRVRQPFRYDNDIYTQEINYEPGIDYGYDVNYKLYYYFVYLNRRFGERFSVPVRV